MTEGDKRKVVFKSAALLFGRKAEQCEANSIKLL